LQGTAGELSDSRPHAVLLTPIGENLQVKAAKIAEAAKAAKEKAAKEKAESAVHQRGPGTHYHVEAEEVVPSG